MSLLPSLYQLSVQGFGLLLVWAALSDVRSFTIPNRVSLAMVILYPVYVLTSPVPVGWLAAAGVATAVFAVGAFAFSRGWFGGGDVKLLTAASLWSGLDHFSLLLIVTALAGAALSLAALAQPLVTPLLAQFRVGRMPSLSFGSGGPEKCSLRTNIPYGVAIAAGGLVIATQLLAR